MKYIIILVLVSVSLSQLTVRNAHSMVYDSNNHRVLLFAGADEKQVHADLWQFKDNQWTEIKADGPSPRTFAAMTYDSQQDALIVFGGNRVLFGASLEDVQLLSDTWIFKNNQWNEIESDQKPRNRAEAVMVYDSDKKQSILFGGYTIDGNSYVKLGDTWQLNNQQWTKINAKGPSPRHNPSFVYDMKRKAVFLFGGSAGKENYGASKGESWIFTDDWQKLDIQQPANIFNAATAYDSDKNQILRFGGWHGKGRTNETWRFENKQWLKLTVDQSPSARNHSAMIYDQINKRFLLFGGHDGPNVFGDLWQFKDGRWTLLNDQKAIKRLANSH